MRTRIAAVSFPARVREFVNLRGALKATDLFPVSAVKPI